MYTMFTSFNCGGKIKRIFHRISFSNANAYMIQTNIPDFTRGYISPIKHSISSLESARCLFSWVMNGHKSSVYISVVAAIWQLSMNFTVIREGFMEEVCLQNSHICQASILRLFIFCMCMHLGL